MENKEHIAYIKQILYKENINYPFSPLGIARILINYINSVVFCMILIFFTTKIFRKKINNSLLLNEKKFFISGNILVLLASFISILIYLRSINIANPPIVFIAIASVIYSVLFFFIGSHSLRINLILEKQDNRQKQQRIKAITTQKESEEKQDFSILRDRLFVLFTEHEVFKNSDLRITDISSMLNTNRTYISTIINNEAGSDFRNFVNKFRVEYAKKTLQNPLKNYLSLAEIAEEAGFSSESSFYRIFRRNEGTTPNSYRLKNFNVVFNNIYIS